jgi:integrase
MPRELLTVAQIGGMLLKPGKHADGAGLYLQVAAKGQASWTFQFRWQGKTKWMSIGPQSLYSLAQAREEHTKLRIMVHEGIDPRTTAVADAGKLPGKSFDEAMTDYLDEASPDWKGGADGKQAISYRHSFDRIPAFKSLPWGSIEPKDIREAVAVWADKPVTQRRMRTRIKTVIKFAKTGEYRSRKPGRKAVNHPSLPFAQVPAFMAELIALGTTESRALAFTILTAARTEEVLGSPWAEIGAVVDNEGEAPQPTWIVEPGRMKAEREHRIPLTPEMLKLLGPRRADDAFLFPGYLKRENPLRDEAMRQTVSVLQGDGEPRWVDGRGRKIVPHGFRSSFRTWVNEKTDYDGALGEFALSHAVGPEIQRVYQHGDALEKRRNLMRDWAAFCMSAA